MSSALRIFTVWHTLSLLPYSYCQRFRNEICIIDSLLASLITDPQELVSGDVMILKSEHCFHQQNQNLLWFAMSYYGELDSPI
jgi:hypothetical protein